MADRISYLIGQDGKIAAVYSSLAAEGHVDAMLGAAAKLKK
jgi:peroxiredoxin